MEKFFISEYHGQDFELFGEIHIITILLLAIINMGLLIWLKKTKSTLVRRVFPYAFSLFIIFNEIIFYVWSFRTGSFSLRASLPLHICDLALIFSAIMLIKPSRFLYETTYFWGMAGSLQAILTPDIAPYNYPHFMFFSFFIMHGAVITAVLFMTLIKEYAPDFKSIWRVMLFTNGYTLFISAVNLITHGNYLFICRKPADPSIMDYLAPWPWYILELELVAVILFMLCYLPFAFARPLSGREAGRSINM